MSNTQPEENNQKKEEIQKSIKILIECPLKKRYTLEYVKDFDTILTIKHAVNEIPDLCFYTSYHFELYLPGNNKAEVLSDYSDLSKYEIVDDTVFKMIMNNYNLSSVKQHIANLREKLRQPPNTTTTDPSSLEIPEVVKRFAVAVQQATEELSKQEEERLKKAQETSGDKKPEEQDLSKIPKVAMNMPKDEPVLPLPNPDDQKTTESTPAAKEIEKTDDKVDTEAISNSLKSQAELFPSLLQKMPINDIPVLPDLTAMYKAKTNTDVIPQYEIPICLKSISHSGWNPPPPNRKLLGDLLYLDIETLEGETFYITCTITGFYVNKSRKDCFDPTPSARPCHSPHLLGLLKQLSVQFRNQFKLLLSNANERSNKISNNLWDSLTKIPIPEPLKEPEWIVESVNDEKLVMGLYHPYDLDRAEGDLLNHYSLDGQLESTDWNEDFQMSVDIADSELETNEGLEIGKYRAMYSYTINFTKACKDIVTGIFDGSIQPLNPNEPPENYFYLYNNILVTRVCDSRHIYTDCGGDDAAYTLVNQDLLGVRTLNRNENKDPHTILTTIIDFKGSRYIAQGLFPGLLQQTSVHVYGSLDNGNTISYDEEGHKLLTAIYKPLGLGESKVHPLGQPPQPEDEIVLKTTNTSTVYKKPEESVNIVGPVETKLIKGSDGRYYIIDVTNITPRDIVCMKERKEKNLPEEIVMLRMELIQNYYLHLVDIEREKAEKKAKESGKDEEFELPSMELNVNIGGKNKLADDDEKIKKDTETIENICMYLKNDMIQTLVQNLIVGEIQCPDSSFLCTLLHNRGINLRYLGFISNSFADDITKFTMRVKFFIELCETEMLCRSVKHLLRELYKIPGVSDVPAFMLSELFNILFGTPGDSVIPVILNETNSKTKGKEQKHKINLGIVSNNVSKFVEPALNLYKPEEIWDKIEDFISKHFDYKLRLFTNPYKSKIDPLVYGLTQRYAVLRRLCMMCGIKINSRNYDFTISNPFSPEDIIDIIPVIKNCIPSSPLPSIQPLIDQAYQYLNIGNYAVAFQIVQQCVLTMLQVTGFAQEDMSICLSTLSVILHNLGDIKTAIDHQKRCARLLTTLYGEGSSRLVRVLESLAIFYHESGDTPEAINVMKRVIYILDICSGDHSIYNVASYIRLGTMARDIGHLPLALEAYKEAIRRASDDPYGQMAALRPLALTCAISGNFDESVSFQTTYYKICKTVLGDDHEQTKEAKSILERFLKVKAAMTKK